MIVKSLLQHRANVHISTNEAETPLRIFLHCLHSRFRLCCARRVHKCGTESVANRCECNFKGKKWNTAPIGKKYGHEEFITGCEMNVELDNDPFTHVPLIRHLLVN